ncbi:hypothetical protein OIU78_003091 [Salix suchowensis]|nr:hypothetical protein OIU78_003091 [Salix suchowensis]
MLFKDGFICHVLRSGRRTSFFYCRAC